MQSSRNILVSNRAQIVITRRHGRKVQFHFLLRLFASARAWRWRHPRPSALETRATVTPCSIHPSVVRFYDFVVRWYEWVTDGRTDGLAHGGTCGEKRLKDTAVMASFFYLGGFQIWRPLNVWSFWPPPPLCPQNLYRLSMSANLMYFLNPPPLYLKKLTSGIHWSWLNYQMVCQVCFLKKLQ